MGDAKRAVTQVNNPYNQHLDRLELLGGIGSINDAQMANIKTLRIDYENTRKRVKNGTKKKKRTGKLYDMGKEIIEVIEDGYSKGIGLKYIYAKDKAKMNEDGQNDDNESNNDQMSVDEISENEKNEKGEQKCSCLRTMNKCSKKCQL